MRTDDIDDRDDNIDCNDNNRMSTQPPTDEPEANLHLTSNLNLNPQRPTGVNQDIGQANNINNQGGKGVGENILK